MDQNRPLNAPPAGASGSVTGAPIAPRPAAPVEINPNPGAGQGGIASKIQHTKPGFVIPAPNSGGGNRASELDETIKPVSRLGDEGRPLPVASGAAAAFGAPAGAKITAFGKEKRHEDCWARTPNTTGAGAIHVKTFHCKLTDEALVYMDQTINEWLDAHPQYEVKFVSTSIGTFTGKLKEPALICQVWV